MLKHTQTRQRMRPKLPQSANRQGHQQKARAQNVKGEPLLSHKVHPPDKTNPCTPYTSTVLHHSPLNETRAANDEAPLIRTRAGHPSNGRDFNQPLQLARYRIHLMTVIMYHLKAQDKLPAPPLTEDLALFNMRCSIVIAMRRNLEASRNGTQF